LFQTQTHIAKSGEYDTTKLSLKLLLVHVFTACGIEVFNIELTQKLISLLSESDNILNNKNLFGSFKSRSFV